MINIQIDRKDFNAPLKYSNGVESILEYIRLNILAKQSNEKECIKIMEYEISSFLSHCLFTNEIIDFKTEINSNDIIVLIKEDYFSRHKEYVYSFEVTLDEKVGEWIYNSIKKLHDEIDLKTEEILKKYE